MNALRRHVAVWVTHPRAVTVSISMVALMLVGGGLMVAPARYQYLAHTSSMPGGWAHWQSMANAVLMLGLLALYPLAAVILGHTRRRWSR